MRRNTLRDFAEGEVNAVGPCEEMAAWLEWLYTVEAHARRPSPDEDVAVFEQDVAGFVGSLHPSKEKGALQSKGDGNDRLSQIALVSILMQAKFVSCLIAIDVTGVGPESWKSGEHGGANSELFQQDRHGWPSPRRRRITGVPAICECARVAAVRNHDGHALPRRRGRLVEGGCSYDVFNGGQKLPVLRDGQAAHEDGSGVEFLMGGFRGELGKEVHRLTYSY
jgi:hypothetical protein